MAAKRKTGDNQAPKEDHTEAANDDDGKVVKLNAEKNIDRIQEAIETVETTQAKIDAIMAEAKKRCRPHVEEIKSTKKAMAQIGIPSAVFGATLRQRRMFEKAANIPNTLTETMRDDFIAIQEGLGDFATTPLGSYAHARSA